MSKDKGTKFYFEAAALACIFVQLWLAAGCSSTGGPKNALPAADNDKHDGRVTLFDPALSFIPPAGFKPIDANELKISLADNEEPRNIFADADQTGWVIVTYQDDLDVEPADLVKAKAFTERTQRGLADWITSEMVEMNGRQWWHFETEDPVLSKSETLVPPPGAGKAKASPAPQEERMHRNAYSTIFKIKLLAFTFQSSVDNYKGLKDSFTQSLQSVQIKE